MKVLLITWTCDIEDVSEPEIVSKWVREISKDHEVTLFSVSRPDRYGCVKEQFPELDVIEWKDISVPKKLEKFRSVAKPGYIPYYFKARRFLRKLLTTTHFDVVHHITPLAWRFPTPAGGLGVPLIRGPIEGGLPTPPQLKNTTDSDAPLYYKLRNLDALRKYLDPVLISSFKKTDRVLFAAQYVQDVLKPLKINSYSLESDHGLLEAQIRPFSFHKRETNRKAVEFLFVGRIVRTKGLRDAIAGLAKSQFLDRVHFTVIGDGDDLQACKALAQTLTINHKIDFKGWQEKPAVEKAYQEADVFLFPSFREPTGGVLLEAMSHSLPIISCKYGGPEYFVKDNTGILIDPSEEESYSQNIAAAIDEMVSNEDLRMSRAKAAWMRATHEFSWKQKRIRLSDLYKQVAQSYNNHSHHK